MSYGKVKLVLQKNRYFVESQWSDVLQTLLKDKVISDSQIKHPIDSTVDPTTGLIISRAPQSVQISGGITGGNTIDSVLQSDDLQSKIELGTIFVKDFDS